MVRGGYIVAEWGDLERPDMTGFDHHLVKPVKLADLSRLLDAHASAHKAG